MEFGDCVSDIDFILEAYSATIELFERTEAYFHDNEYRDYPKILEELKNCCSKIEFLITLETEEENSAFLIALFQQKQQLYILIEIVEKLHATNSTNQYHLQDTIKKPKLPQNDSVVTDTIEIPKICGFSEIVGLHEIKKVLKSLVILPKTQPQLFHDRNLCNTILLFGPPGTGKTRLVHALAAESGAQFHCIAASDVLSHYVGQTEKAIKMLFGYLKRNENFSILFIDEIDSFCRKRSENEQEHTRRIKTELMCQMSGIEGCTNTFIICATNCPWDLDVAILRRFQRRIYVPLPSKLERMEFFQYFQKDLQLEDLESWTPLLDKTDGYSGSDLSDIAQTALNIPLIELESTIKWRYSDDGFYEPACEKDCTNVIYSELGDLPEKSVKARQVRMGDFLKAADSVICTVSPVEVKRYELFAGKQ